MSAVLSGVQSLIITAKFNQVSNVLGVQRASWALFGCKRRHHSRSIYKQKFSTITQTEIDFTAGNKFQSESVVPTAAIVTVFGSHKTTEN